MHLWNPACEHASPRMLSGLLTCAKAASLGITGVAFWEEREESLERCAWSWCPWVCLQKIVLEWKDVKASKYLRSVWVCERLWVHLSFSGWIIVTSDYVNHNWGFSRGILRKWLQFGNLDLSALQFAQNVLNSELARDQTLCRACFHLVFAMKYVVRWILVDCWMFCIIFPGVDISTKSLQLLWVVWKFGIVENHYNINQQPKAPKQHLTANHWMIIIYPVSLWPRAEWFAPKSCFFHRLHPQAESWQETVEQVGWHTFRRVARVDFSGPCARYSIETTYYSLWSAYDYVTWQEWKGSQESTFDVRNQGSKTGDGWKKMVLVVEFDVFGALSLVW